MMTLVERHQNILDRVRRDQRVRIAQLSRELAVSSVTIRKDLRLLEQKNLIYRRGGQAFAKQEPVPSFIQQVERKDVDGYAGLAFAAAGLLAQGDSIMVAAGRPMLALAERIPEALTLTVVTSSLEVALSLLDRSSVETMQLPGLINRSGMAASGSYALNALQGMFFDKCFLNVDGIDPRYGLTMDCYHHAELSKEVIRLSKSVIVLADSSQFGKRTFSRIVGIDKVDQVITDSGIDRKIAARLTMLGITVTIV